MAIRKEGAFIEIGLPNGQFTYGRILPKASFAFYNIYSDKKVEDVKELVGLDVLFITAVYKAAISTDRWKIIGFSKLKPELSFLQPKFIQDESNPEKFKIYDPNTGDMKFCKKEECVGLERATVWEPEHIEERIVDHFEKRPNALMESLKLQ
jgi:immunity protein 26 of polymorphic toxin system